MKKIQKNTKGITLIALVITIIILLILVGISIIALTGENGLFSRAKQAKQNTLVEKEQEKNIINGYNSVVDSSLGDKKNILPVDTVVQNPESYGNNPKAQATVDGKGKIFAKPLGATYIEGTVDTGVVIELNGSQFVWIPVNNVVADKEGDGTSNKAMAIKNENNYTGLLYKFTDDLASSVIQGCTTTITDNREPYVLEKYDGNTNYLKTITDILSEQSEKYSNIDSFKQTLQDDYNSMIESILKYGGFYVGRYETSLNGSTVQSVYDKKPIGAKSSSVTNMWYGMYAMQKAYYTDSVQGHMIWGSQYDAIMNFVLTGKDKNKVRENTNGNHKTTINTGKTATDVINNIFDLEGNYYEWTVEANCRYGRIRKGGSGTSSGSPSDWWYSSPCNTSSVVDSYNGTRLSLYIK